MVLSCVRTNLPKRLLNVSRSVQFLRYYIAEPPSRRHLWTNYVKSYAALSSTNIKESFLVTTLSHRAFSSLHLTNVERRRNRIPDARERDILPSSNDDPDVFGTIAVGRDEVSRTANRQLRELASDVESIFTPEEADDIVFKPDHPWTMDRLRRQVFEYLREKKLKLALDTFLQVLQDGGFPMNQKDISFICTTLICACARAGNVDMAFLLFDKMKQRGLAMKESWYTSLFNACANSPWDSEQNLLRIEKIRSHMTYKGFEPNQTHFHAMIKAYGRCGALQAAFSVVDEMRLRIQETQQSDLQIRITTETFNFLLQACISDKENGYRHAVVTWQKMLKMKIKPDLYSYRLFLRAIRECDIQLPKKDTKERTPLIGENNQVHQARLPEIVDPAPGTLKQNVDVIEFLNTEEEDTLRKSGKEIFPLIEKSNTELQRLLKVPENRFAILGGMRAFMTQMDIHKVKIDLKTATEYVMNVSTAEVPDVLMMLETKGLKPDIHFLNLAMKKYMRWQQDDKARKLLELFANYNVTPNIMTFGVLAMGARNWTECNKLLIEMDTLGVVPNEAIFGALVLNACRNYDPRYLIRLMEEHVRREIKPNEYFVGKIINFKEYVHKAIVDVECGREVRPRRLNSIVKTPEFTEYWEKLNHRFESWVRQLGVTESEIPWKKDTKERLERLKNRRLQPEIYRD